MLALLRPTYAQKLLDAETDLDVQDTDGETVLIWAAAQGKLECVQWLIDSKAEIDAKDNSGPTALMKAAENGNSDCVQLLIDAKADLEAEDNLRWTALIWAPGSAACMELIVHGFCSMLKQCLRP